MHFCFGNPRLLIRETIPAISDNRNHLPTRKTYTYELGKHRLPNLPIRETSSYELGKPYPTITGNKYLPSGKTYTYELGKLFFVTR